MASPQRPPQGLAGRERAVGRAVEALAAQQLGIGDGMPLNPGDGRGGGVEMCGSFQSQAMSQAMSQESGKADCDHVLRQAGNTPSKGHI